MMSQSRFFLHLGLELDLQVLECFSPTFTHAWNLKTEDMCVKIPSGQVWVTGKGGEYLSDLCVGSRVHFHAHCIGKLAKNTSSEFQYASNEDYTQMGHRNS